MKKTCYNKGTKEKETNKKCLKFSKNKKETSQCKDKGRRKVRQSAVGIRRKKKV